MNFAMDSIGDGRRKLTPSSLKLITLPYRVVNMTRFITSTDRSGIYE